MQIISGFIVPRNGSRWATTFEEYPGEIFPDYCMGFIVLFSRDVVMTLYEEVQRNPYYFWLEDITFTGIIASRHNLSHTPFGDWALNLETHDEALQGKRSRPFFFGRQNLNEMEIRKFWALVNEKQNN